ncbi:MULTISPECIES: hypothetical protein [Streptococcus]|uniref:Uncharacterized protein n=1 Tax=Streptococcus caledonicus TaxID=2614158 RepID=A0ABW0UCL2_9STRE|nr:hypothetical protein [Streptococcus sp. S784/96/1]
MKKKRHYIFAMLMSLLVFSSGSSLSSNYLKDKKVIIPKTNVVFERATNNNSGLDVGKAD